MFKKWESRYSDLVPVIRKQLKLGDDQHAISSPDANSNDGADMNAQGKVRVNIYIHSLCNLSA